MRLFTLLTILIPFAASANACPPGVDCGYVQVQGTRSYYVSEPVTVMRAVTVMQPVTVMQQRLVTEPVVVTQRVYVDDCDDCVRYKKVVKVRGNRVSVRIRGRGIDVDDDVRQVARYRYYQQQPQVEPYVQSQAVQPTQNVPPPPQPLYEKK